ncbi:MAG TPA: TlpA disulfide reductase family protein [Candidatus Tyrphobacter sp.]
MRVLAPWLFAVVAIAIVAVVLVPLFRLAPTRSAGPTGLAGQTAAVVALRDDRGAPVALDRYRGKVVLMNLWASWCPPCRAELPDLQRLWAEDAGRGLVVVGVDQGESAQRARSFASSLGVRFPIWIDADQAYGRAYAALGLPTTVIVDRRGIVANGFDGALTYVQMRAAVAPLLSRR